MSEFPVQPFKPHPWLRSGHLQTIVGSFRFGRRIALPSTYHEVRLGDGDRLTVFESRPADWVRLAPSVLMVHGLAGSVRSDYLKRIAFRLWKSGVRVVRMNLRGAGAGFGLAKGIYHAGRTEDLRAVADWMAEREPESRLGLVGFSMGANLVLKLAAESSTDALQGLDCVVAVNPPIDLKECSLWIQRPENRIYNRNFLKLLKHEIERLHRRFPELGVTDIGKVGSVYEFDDRYTSRRNGFKGADHYYETSSSQQMISRIKVDGLVIHSENDPFIPVDPFHKTEFPETLVLELIPGGGHLGYLTEKSWNGSRRWLDNRVTTWFSRRWNLNSTA